MSDMAKHSTRMTGDQARRVAMWILASGVAAIAAVVSYSHIYDLGRAHGGTGVPARLLPLSVDMLILVGELMLLHEADGKGRRFVLGWVLVWSGILATLAANVTFGAQFGAVGAVIWGWPAYSFILAAAGMVSVVKRTALPADSAPVVTEDVAADTDVASNESAVADDSVSDSGDETPDLADVAPVVTPEVAADVTPEVVPDITPDVTPEVMPETLQRRRRVVPARASDEELAELVLPLFEDGSEVTRYRVIKVVREAAGGKVGIGDKRAGDVLELARRKRVVPIGERMRA